METDRGNFNFAGTVTVAVLFAFVCGISCTGCSRRHPAEPEMVFVKGGTFTMGCTGNDCFDWEKPAHSVTLSSFKIGKYEVTKKQWQLIMNDGSTSEYPENDDYPAENVSWDDVQAFIAELNALTGKKYRLPTEAEWEYAARGGSQSQGYEYSGSNNIGDVAWYINNNGYSMHPAGAKAPNELGIYDMSGSVFEWCNDWYEDYSPSPQTNPQGPSSGSYRVLRGGSWLNYAIYCRVTYRINYAPGDRYSNVGFRLVLQ